MSDPSDDSGSGGSEPKSPPLTLASEPKPSFSATDEESVVSEPESDWGSEPIFSPRIPESESPVLVSDGASLLEFKSSSSASKLGLGSAPEGGRDEATHSPCPEEWLHKNTKSGFPDKPDAEATGSSDEDSPSSSGSEATASPNGLDPESVLARHTPTGEPGHGQGQGQGRDEQLGLDQNEELQQDRSTRGSSASGSTPVSSSAPSQFYTLLLERLGHMERRTQAVEARAAHGVFLAEVELAAAVEMLQDTVAEMQAQLKLALEDRARDAALAADVRQLLKGQTWSGQGASASHSLDHAFLIVTVSIAVAVVLMRALYPMI